MSWYRIRTTPEQEAQFAAAKEQQRADLTVGKITVRWSQGRCGYVIWSGRTMVLGLEIFISEAAAWNWLEETHNIVIGQ